MLKKSLSGLGLLMIVALGFWAVRPAASPPAQEKTWDEKGQDVPRTPDEWAALEVQRKLQRRAEGYFKPDGPDLFAQYHRLIRTRPGDAAPAYRAGYRMEALQEALAARKAGGPLLDWTEHGPGNVSGRTRALVVDLDADPAGNTWFAGAAGGGIWHTTDAGLSWTNRTPDLPNLATVALAQAAGTPDVLYAGTGEGFGNADGLPGDGIWKTTDRGITWAQLTATAGHTAFTAVNRLVVHPADADVVVAATNNGLYRTADGGMSWTQVQDRFAGQGRFQQVVATPGNFDVLYAASNGTGVYRSDDAGATWAQVFDLPSGARLELAVAPSRPQRVYAAVQDDGQASTLYLTDDAGAGWQQVTDTGSDASWLSGQGWYDNAVVVHPYDADVVFVGGINLWRLDVDLAAGTRTTTELTNWYPNRPNRSHPDGVFPYVHADHHALVTVPLDPSAGTFRLLNGNDGGVEYSDDGGVRWQKTLNGYNSTQFYGADKRPGADAFIGGMQDNGTWRSPTDAGPASAWTNQLGGDGFDAVWHHDDPDRLMGSIQFNNIARSLDGGATWSSATEGLDDLGRGKGNFITALAQTDADPDLLFTTGASGIWRTDDFGATWTPSTLSGGAWNFGGLRTPIAISQADPRVVWSGVTMSGDLRPFRSTDGGVTFAPVTSAPGVSAYISGIATHPSDPETAFLLFATANQPKILRTTDGGATWASLTDDNGFPNVATFSLAVMPHDPDELWAGTEIGLFVSTDGGASWQYADNGLPAVAVWQLSVVDDRVVVATHGRGVWSARLPELAGHTPPVVTRAPRLSAASVTPAGALRIHAALRSPYDSVQVRIDGRAVARLPGNAAVRDTMLAFPIATEASGTASVALVAYRTGEAYPSATRSVFIFDAGQATTTYTTAFDAETGDFSGEGLAVGTVAGFTSPALHSPHPYADNATLTYRLNLPIRVAAEGAVVRYRDVAIIEPGEPGTVFGDAQFWDYVILEATTDGATWVPLSDGYDAGAHAAWRTAYLLGRNGDASLFVDHEVNLLDTFAPGDLLFLRFRLFADAGAHGWGWAVDDLEIQPEAAVATEDAVELPGAYALAQNYPNPFNPATTITFTAPRAGAVTLRVYDLQGRLVATLAEGSYPAGRHEVRFDAGRLASGVYVYRLEAPGVQLHRMLTLIK